MTIRPFSCDVRPSRHGQRGLSLLEMMVSVVLMVLFIGTATTAFIAHGRLHRSQSDLREAQEGARTALNTIERHLRLAGYGIGSEFAFDFSRFRCDGADGGGVCPDRRDRANGPDELVFHARSATYFAPPGDFASAAGHSWVVDPATTLQSLVLQDNGTVPEEGQILVAICPGGYTYAYVTVDDVGAGGTLTTGHENDDPFRQGNELGRACFSSGVARAFVVNRFRFFIGDEDGVPIVGAPPAAPDRPYLYLDRGIPGQTRLLVAADIEDLQIAYIMRGGDAFGTAGAPHIPDLSPPSAQCAGDLTVDLYQQFAVSPCQLTTPARTSNYVANIVAVRLTVVARTPAPIRNERNELVLDPAYAPDLFAFENRNRGTDPDGYKRVRLSTTVWLPNMNSTGIPLL